MGNETNTIVRALTVQQPWAWAILKRIYPFIFEPFAPKLRGYFLVHAGMAYDFDAHQWFAEHMTEPPYFLPKAQVLGYARLMRVQLRPGIPHPEMERREFAFRIMDGHEFPIGQVAAGRRGFWKVPRGILKEIELPAHVMKMLLK